MLLSLFFCLNFFLCEAKLPDLTPQDVVNKTQEIMKSHASHKELTPALAQRVLTNYLEQLDANKTYFIESDIEEWVQSSDPLLQQIVDNYNEGNFSTFKKIHEAFVNSINRRRRLEKDIDYQNLPTNVKSSEFKDIPWAKNEEELKTRLERMKALLIETAAKFNDEMREKSLLRIQKRQTKYEEDMLQSNPQEQEKLILSNVLKATASALDTHTSYFTPDEAKQFLFSVQQSLYGIGSQLRDDINGFTIIKNVEGSPAALSKLLKVKDRIVAVNGEPVVGMDITDAVELIRGEANTPVLLTVIRDSIAANGEPQEEKLDVEIMRGEVIVKESRYKSSYEPYGDGVIGYLKLYSFYQDRENSSAIDLENEIKKLKKEHDLKGIILDLRYNSGGLLSQAVAVTGLFITKGTVVSIKDEKGRVQHLRNLNESVTWDGPLVILVNRMSASASEIVAQALKDYGRAIVIGDDHTFGKGSYQTFTLAPDESEQVNPKGEYKVTRGRYYTVSGISPQLNGVESDILIPGPLIESEVGERYAQYPLESDQIKPNFNDDLSDVPILQRDSIRKIYKFNLQKKLDLYQPFMEKLKENAKQRINMSLNYQNFLKEVAKKDSRDFEKGEDFGQNDLQLEEANAVMKDLILMMEEKGLYLNPARKQALTKSSLSEHNSQEKRFNL
jgi:carboxyl-terminal processing protease